MNMKKKILVLVVILVIGISGYVVARTVFDMKITKAQKEAEQLREKQVKDIIESRKNVSEESDEDPFGEDNILKVLLLGIDSRAGDTHGHCDAIQMIEFNRNYKTIKITAVPRGTYAPLPGTGYKPSDYYVSNSCGIVGIEYGIEQIERILGEKADFIAMVGFSEAMGIFRSLDLPTIETMQWLRNRQSFAIGEPQRARNHSTFIKQMFLKLSADENTKWDMGWQYLIFRMVETDLSFSQARVIAGVLDDMNLENEAWRVTLAMRPAFEVAYIPYDEEHLDEQLKRLIDPIVHLLPEIDYSGESKEAIQKRLLNNINNGLDNAEFVEWAYDNQLWLQIEDDETRDKIHFEIIIKYIDNIDDLEIQEDVLAEFIIEMENRGLTMWVEEGEEYLEKLIN